MNRIFKVSCPKFLGEHVGVYVENWGMVFHNAPGKGEHLSALENFAPPDHLSFEEITSVSPDLIEERIRQILNRPGKYSLTENNCDHAYNKVITGRAVSPQLQNVGKSFAIVGVCILLFTAFKKG